MNLKVTLVTLVVGLLASVPAQAAFPGANGRLALTRCNTSCSNDADIWSVAPDGSAPLQLTSGTSYDEDSSYSADGARITFERCGPGDTTGCAISVMNADGSAVVPLTPGTKFDYY